MNEDLKIRAEPFKEFYTIGDEIGSGQFAVVKTCTEKNSGQEFAAKFMKKKRTRACRRGVSAEQIAREAGVLRKVRHDGIIYLHEVFEAKHEYVLVMELLSGGELFEFLTEREYINEGEAAQFTRQVVEAVAFLHELSIVHLDIKPENVVLKSKGKMVIKLIDFGLAREIKLGETVKEIMGTPEFVAPEIINFESIYSPTDMWSVGVLAYILLSGASPFLGDDNNETFNNILNVDYEFDDEYFSGISEQAKEFVSSLLVKNPKGRMTAKDCLEHVWLEPQKFQRRKNTLIKTASFKTFTARARWKKSFQKVMAVNRIKLIGKKSEAKEGGGVVLQVCTEILDENKNEAVEEVTEEMETYVEESAAEVLEGEEISRRVRVKSVRRHEKKPYVVKDNTVGTNKILNYEDEDDNPWRRLSMRSARERRKRGNVKTSNDSIIEEEEVDGEEADGGEHDSIQKDAKSAVDNEGNLGSDKGKEGESWMAPPYVRIDVNDIGTGYKQVIDLIEDDVIRPFELGHESLAYEICKTLQTFPELKQYKETSV